MKFLGSFERQPMARPINKTRQDSRGKWILTVGLVFWFFVFVGLMECSSQEQVPPKELTTAAQVRQLTPTEAARHHPVHLHAVVTYFDERSNNKTFRFVQDDTAGIYLYPATGFTFPALTVGKMVDVQGQTAKGEYAPVVEVKSIKILGEGVFPTAQPVTFEELASGRDDSQFVQISGTVRFASLDEEKHFYEIEIATGGGRLTAYATAIPGVRGEDLVDSIVKVSGVCATHFNRLRQLFDVRLVIPRPGDLIVEKPTPKDPFNIPARDIETLLQFSTEGTYGHRVKVKGTVIYRGEDNSLYIQDENEGLYVVTHHGDPVQVGKEVEVLGFPAKGEYTPMLEDAVFRVVGAAPPVQPDLVNADEALKGTHDCRLVRIEATVLDRAQQSRDKFLVLQDGGFIFHAYLGTINIGPNFSDLENGSKVAVTGVCVIETGNSWFAGDAWRAKSFRILLRSIRDITVLQRPPWWNFERVLRAVVVLAAVVLAAFVWVAVLRRRVHKQTQIIRQKLQSEAIIKRRYEDLFENANDIVFTHDLTGRITSVNKTGERILKLGRDEIVCRNLLDLVVKEQRVAAQQWLDQIGSLQDLPATEWDFLSASGQRIRLEISGRKVEPAGSLIEVECIARDVTERKELEKELLEISAREQRRIGHDLHDGVCQHLAGIAYRVDILADQLQEKRVTEAEELERIGGFINDVITQTRGVARGLSPANLSEDGLESALDGLAARASSFFNITCKFECDDPLPPIEDGTQLHLYYIVQEAVSNAAKHGKASTVKVSLQHIGDRFALSVQDDGSGFQPPAGASSGMGIRIMRYRARVIGATLELISQAGKGTLVTCVFYSHSNETAPALDASRVESSKRDGNAK